MRISFTRFSVVVVVVAIQWLAVLAIIRVASRNERIFADFSTMLPRVSVIAMTAAQPKVLALIAGVTTAIVVVAEILLKSATGRSAVRAAILLSWLALTLFCVIGLQMPLFTILNDLSQR